MGQSLHRYLEIKVHPDIKHGSYESIRVIGEHSRTPPARVSSIEKTDKPFNWQRPTSLMYDSGTIDLLCFPGPDSVKHYASIVATYLDLIGKDSSVTSYAEPSDRGCMEPLLASNLASLGQVDTVVLGYVHGLKRFISSDWQGGDANDIFAWQKMRASNGTSVAFIGCRVSFWGDIAGNVVRALQRLNGVKTVLYIGKLGTLRPEIPPNQWLATGTTSMLDGELVEWRSVLDPHITCTNNVVRGAHYSLPSVLDETKDWLETHRHTFAFVDPEIGHMAKASIQGGTDFAYLHIISDNIAKKYSYDLSNERLQQVIKDREMLLTGIQDTLEQFFTV
ncbi:hypothetical protein DOTSEDRAFT_62968 [Dothistroma septosporum NZE10]|uniref:Uncharacterized protein n=1 Tax=Dothistroma septosporum (strain NZE10 / CBS 128990) TaxID=675120 RepID=N1PM72_DOTSN|nr:hypothetical protein DOTSEDRAFT_62968 [Dothistroma septosporum NZE10]